MRGKSCSSLEHNLWVPAVGMDALSASCAASGEAQGALASPDPKGFVVL